MILFGYGLGALGDIAHVPWLHGLKIVAVAVVAQAVWGMARNLCSDPLRASVAVAGALLALAVPSAAIGVVSTGSAASWRRWARRLVARLAAGPELGDPRRRIKMPSAHPEAGSPFAGPPSCV